MICQSARLIDEGLRGAIVDEDGNLNKADVQRLQVSLCFLWGFFCVFFSFFIFVYFRVHFSFFFFFFIEAVHV